MKTRYLWRNLRREIQRTLLRLLSIFSISAIGVAFFTGIRASGPDMKLTADNYLDEARLPDITAMSTAGLNEDDIEALEEIPGVETVEPVLTVDALMQRTGTDEVEYNIHMLSLPFPELLEHPMTFSPLPDYGIDTERDHLDRLQLISGRLPEDDHEIVLDSLLQEKGFQIGDSVTLTTSGGSTELYVTGFVESARYISNFDRGTSTIGSGKSDGFAYASGNAIGKLGSRMPMMAMFAARYTQVEISVSGAAALNCFSDEYEQLIDEVVRRIEAYGDTTDATWYVQTRSSNPGYSDYSANTDRIAAVGMFFPLIFLIVAALVALTTMTRMVEEQRIQMGTLKALGYSQFSIMLQYLMYAILASLVGSVLGSLLGFWLFPTVIGSAYGIMYRLPNFQTPYWADIAVLSILAVVGCVTLAAALVSVSTLREVPASLMRPKAPKPGKRVFLERIPWLWKRLNFTAKVTVRNLIRYKKRFWMSVIGIAGSCALLLTGFGLSDSIYGIAEKQFEEIWTMDIQAYTYDAMSQQELSDLLASQDDGSFGHVSFFYEKTVKGGAPDAADSAEIHLFAVHDPGIFAELVHLRDTAGNPIELTDAGVVTTRKLAELYGLSVGDTLYLESGSSEYEVPISAIAENYVYHYAYFTPALYEQVMGEPLQYNGIMANIDGLTEENEDEWAQRMLTDKRVYSVVFLSDIFDTIWDSLSVLNYVIGILILSAGALSFVVLLNLTNINITERRRELATLQVLGFTDREMYDYVFRENNSLSAIGALLGLLLGRVLHQFVIVTCEVDMVTFVREIMPLSYVYSLALSVVFSLTVNLLMRRKVRSIDMVESLKSAE